MTDWIRISLLVLITLSCGCKSTRPAAQCCQQVAEPIDSTAVKLRDKQTVGIQQVAFLQEVRSATDLDNAPNATRSDPQSFATDSTRVIGTMDAIQSLAISINPAIQKAQAEINSLKGKHCQSGLPPNPTIGVLGDDINEDGSAGRYGVFVGRREIRGNKLGLSQSVVCAEIQAAELALVELQQRLITDVRLRYYDLLVAIEKSNLASQLVRLSSDAVDATRKLFDAKELARTSLLQAELEFQNASVTQRTADNDVLAARRNLAVLIGEQDLPFDSFEGSLEEFDELDIETQFNRIVDESPEIAAMFAEVAVARRNLARQSAEPIGDLTWQTSLAYDTASDDLVATFQIGLPIPTLNRNQGAIYQARQQIVAAERETDAKALQLRERLIAAFRQYIDAKLQVDAFDAQILPKARETLKLISEGYRQGEVGFLDLLTAQRTFFRTNLANIEQQREMWRSRIQIEGLMLFGSLD